MVRNKSRRKRGDQILGVLSAQRAEQFLCDLVNLNPANQNRSWVIAWAKRYQDIMPNNPNLILDVIAIRELLQKAWDSREQRRREWWLHEAEAYTRKQHEGLDLRERYGDDLVEGVFGRGYLNPGEVLHALRIPEPPEIVTPIEATLFHFRQRADKARHCANPTCANPYFFLSRKGQKFCTSECATPARRASKLRWWHQNRAH